MFGYTVILSINHGNLRLPRYQMPHTPPGHKAFFLGIINHHDEMLSESWEVLLPRIAGFLAAKLMMISHGKRGNIHAY